MKKILALILAAIMLVSVVACTRDNNEDESKDDVQNETPDNGTEEPTEDEGSAIPEVSVTPLDALTTIWNALPEDQRPFAMGGSFDAMVDGMPGEFNLEMEEAALTLDSMTHYPEAQFDKLTGVATIMHAMNANTFTGAAYSFADAETTTAMVDVIKEAVANTQWMCGFPEKLVIVNVSDTCLIVMFGAGEIIDPLANNAVELLSGTVVVDQGL